MVYMYVCMGLQCKYIYIIRDFENSSEIVIVILDHKPTLLAGNMGVQIYSTKQRQTSFGTC